MHQLILQLECFSGIIEIRAVEYVPTSSKLWPYMAWPWHPATEGQQPQVTEVTRSCQQKQMVIPVQIWKVAAQEI